MDKTDYFDKMDELVKDKQTYQELKRNPTPAIQWKLNRKILTLKKTDTVDIQHYYRLSCSVPQPPTLYGLLELHKPGIPMQAIVSFCGSPTYQLSKYLTTTLQPLTDKSQRKLQSMGNFIAAIKTVQIPDNYKFVSFDVKSLFTGIPLQLALQSTKTAIQQSTIKLLLPTEDIMDLLDLCFTSTSFSTTVKTTSSCMEQPWVACFCCCHRNCVATCGRTCPCNLLTNNTALVTLLWQHFYCRSQRQNWRFPWPP